MHTKRLHVGGLISAINQFTDNENDICEWGEWMVSYAVDCAMNNTKPHYHNKLAEIAGEDFADIIMSEYERDFKRIELAVSTQRGNFFDYSVTPLGVTFVGH